MVFPMSASRGVQVVTPLALLVGCALVYAADLMLFMQDDSCPQWEDEGSMAAPGSPYSVVMCGPGLDPPFVWAVYAGLALAVVVSVFVLLRRSTTFTRAVPWLGLVLVGPTLLVGLLHLTLPQDCLSGRTESGDCSRDREMR